MNPETFNRLHHLRMENDAAGFAMDEMRPRFERLQNRHENGAAPRVVVAHQLFQTPPELAAQLVAMLDIKPQSRILEPSAGLGRILDALKPFSPSEVVAVEIAAACASELFTQERERVTIKQRDFLSLTPDTLGHFDAVAMNPPFHMRADIRHIEHARQFLKPGGKLAAICMNTEHRRKALKHLCSQWIEVDPGAFKKEGTNVPVVMLLMEV